MPVSINESERSCNCVVCVSVLSLSTIVPLDFETVSTVSYFLFFILLLDNLYMACSRNCLPFPSTWCHPYFWLGLYCWVFFCVVFCWTLFAFLPLFSYPLCCLFSINGFWLILLVSPKLLLCSCINNIFSSHCGHSNGNYLFTFDFLFLLLIFKKNIEHKFICLQQ